MMIVAFGFAAPAARATACPGDTHDFVSEAWTAGAGADVRGFRAPTTMRAATLCTTSGGEASFSAEWVATEGNSTHGNNGLGIIQIGWLKDEHQPGPSCRFYYWDRGDNLYTPPAVVEYKCGVDSVGATEFFKADDILSPGLQYSVFDCGTADWSTCTLKGTPNFSESDWTGSTIFALAASEVDYAPQNNMMGSQSNPGEYKPMAGKRSSDGWQTRTLVYGAPIFTSIYKSPVHTNTDLQVYTFG